MLKLLNFTNVHEGPARLETARLTLRRPEHGDFEQWAALRATSAAFLKPFEPKWARDELSKPSWRIILRRQQSEIAGGRSLPWFIFLHDGTLVGGLALGNIRRKVSQSATLGYWMGQPHAGDGIMSEAVGTVCTDTFARLGLHRIEAAAVPENEASRRVLLRNRFQMEGTARAYLQIAGQWRDHHLFARLASD